MQPPDALIAKGVTHLPTCGESRPALPASFLGASDGRQSGTSESPSILNASPEALAGGGLAILRTGDTVILDLQRGELNVDISEDEIKRRYGVGNPIRAGRRLVYVMMKVHGCGMAAN
eukprot:scaffold132205_cov33-Tisochrysis_lutea.AAC.2